MKKIGQFIMTGVEGKELTEEEMDFIENENIGGVILFSHNYSNPLQLAKLTNQIQSLRQKYPLFISVDHEGGRVIRFKKDFTHFPPMLNVSALNSPKIIYDIHQQMGLELKTCGINLSYSPVCDVLLNRECLVIGDRAFGENAEDVSKNITAAIQGLLASKVLGVAKHFPGHGRTNIDSHFDLPSVNISLKQWEEEELPPFEEAIKNKIQFIMMAHLVLNCLDKENPASFSQSAHDYLRQKLNYKKIIISDDLEMLAVNKKFSLSEAAVQAIKIGADMLIFRTFKTAKIGLEALKTAENLQEISSELIDEKYRRISDVKDDFLKDYNDINLKKVEEFFQNKTGEKLLDSIHSALK